MKILFVLCALVAAVYCEHSEMYFKDNCIGIKHIVPDKPGSNGFLISGSYEVQQICCDEGFDQNTRMTGFSKDLLRNEISAVVEANYDRLKKSKSNCKRAAFGIA